MAIADAGDDAGARRLKSLAMKISGGVVPKNKILIFILAYWLYTFNIL